MSERLARFLRHALAVLLSALFLLPLWWVLVASLREPGLPPPNTVQWWPAAPFWDNYPAIFRVVSFARYALNSAIVVAVAVPLTLITASLAGLGLAQLEGAWRRRVLMITIGLLIVPSASGWMFRFQLLRWLHLLDSLWALIVPALGASSPLFVLLFTWAFRHTPAEVYEAARLDGADGPTLWWHIALPLARPTVAAVTVLSFALYWSDFVSPVLYIFDPEWYTLPVALQLLRQVDATNWPWFLAGAVLQIAPVVIIFALLQRSFLRSALLDVER